MLKMNKESKKWVFATNNLHKLQEIIEKTGNAFELLSLSELGFSGEIPEEADSLEGNAAQKAFFIYDRYGVNCFADDTGLEIDALKGAPGVYSARYAGEKCTFDDNIDKVLHELAGITNRKARFRTVIALVDNGRLVTFEGMIPGTITTGRKGTGGFGYDPVFMPDGYDRTFAEMSLAEKNAISHRALAVEKLITYINSHS
jgi:XTP/dITP diphosphohydrolase